MKAFSVPQSLFAQVLDRHVDTCTWFICQTNLNKPGVPTVGLWPAVGARLV